MSLRAILWALEEAPVDDPQTLLVLIALADRASSDGTAAWPTRAWIAQRARCSVETVKRRLNVLKDDGLIRQGDQQYVAHLRADRRPVVYDLNLSKTRGTIETPGGFAGGHEDSHGGSQTAPRGVTADPQTVLIEPREEPSTSAPTKTRSRFDEFWSIMPHRKNPSDNKTSARRDYTKALKQVDEETLIAAAKVYAAENGDKDRQYIIHTYKWLQGEGWEECSPTRAGDSIDECLTEGAMERLEELTGMVFEANYLALQELRGDARKSALVAQWRVWVERNRERLEAKLSSP